MFGPVEACFVRICWERRAAMILEQSEFDLLADAILLVHTLFVGFVVVGQLLILAGWVGRWNWTRGSAFRIAHLSAIGFVVLEAWFNIPCPLTVLEDALRRMAGAKGYELSFVGYWLSRLLFYTAPDWIFITIYTVFALLVVFTFIAYPPRRLNSG